MQLKEIFAKENSRKELADYGTIYLVPEGTFYRAYEWSAWLCHRYVSQFKVTHRQIKNTEESVVFVGFPITSLERYVPENASVVEMEDKVIALVLHENIWGDGFDLERSQADFNNWKSCVPLAKSKTTKSKIVKVEDDSSVKAESIEEVIRRILAYPIEQRTPLETMIFLSQVKQQLSELAM